MGKKITKDKWEWDGYAKHFCAANNCLFVMSTKIGDVVISTVGDYRPEGKSASNMEEIGLHRFFETMTFKAVKAACQCCEWGAATSDQLEWSGSYQTAHEARKGHIEICEQVAGLRK